MLRLVARIGRAHGLRGEVTVALHTDEPEQRFRPGTEFSLSLAQAEPGQRLSLRAAREHSGTWLLAFDEVADRTAAEKLKGQKLYLDLPAQPGSEPDAWYPEELVGLTAVSVDGVPLGEVAALLSGGAQDLLAIRRDDQSKVLVPFVLELVPIVDIPGGRVVLDPPGGMFSDAD